ncbi:RNA-directed DNA polymerase, eukaryota, reverse transcriptase zinc-binding domain protein, partial [Tanacetum coccineum]
DNEEDVIEVNHMATSNLVADEINVLETHLKAKNINRVCDRIFSQWEWISNVKYSPTSCRICIGWDPMVVKVVIIHESRQRILCKVENVVSKENIVSSIVYAANTRIKRRELWKALSLHKRIVGTKSWMLMGDFNVTLKHIEHSAGSSFWIFYTWTKSLRNLNNSILKKLDRVMINESFMKEFGKAHGVFLPYMMSDHSRVQQAKIKWITDGDKNIAFFHSTLKARRHKNIIETMCDENGDSFEGEMVVEQFVKHFKNFLGEAKLVHHLSYVAVIIKTKLNMEEASNMIVDVTDKEIKASMFDIDNKKALGPDGFSSCFFKKAWEFIRQDVCNAIKEFSIMENYLVK